MEIGSEETADDGASRTKALSFPTLSASRLPIEPRDFVSLLPSLLLHHRHFAISRLSRITISHSGHIPQNRKMINAFLVFNNAGQPRLTKFYTQLVRPSTPLQPQPLTATGNISPTTSHRRNLPASIPPPNRLLQFPTSTTAPGASVLPASKLNTT
jgi:hypothetical protein